MAKQIYFHVDAGSMPISFYDESTSMSYYETCELLSEKADTIHTTDMAHFSFDLIDMGYEIYLCYKDKKVKIEPDMTIEPIGKHLKRGHNIRKLFIGHAFDDMLGIECKKPVMRPKFLVSDEVVCEMTVRKVEEVMYSTEFNSYMYKLDKGGWFLESALKPNVQDNKKAYFKVGDFICHKYNSIYGDCRQICDISDDSYLCTIPGSVAATCSISLSEQGNWRLWTIEDAKDGDVITNGELIVIFNKLEEPSYKQRVIAYAGLDLCGRLQITEDTWQLGIDKAMPATKEQRDLLFAKMREAGYEWDEKNKELKKIQTHYDITNFSAGMPVLVRDDKTQKWDYNLFSRIDNDSEYKFVVCGDVNIQCIPFEGNEHLLGTTDMCGEEFINW